MPWQIGRDWLYVTLQKHARLHLFYRKGKQGQNEKIKDSYCCILEFKTSDCIYFKIDSNAGWILVKHWPLSWSRSCCGTTPSSWTRWCRSFRRPRVRSSLALGDCSGRRRPSCALICSDFFWHYRGHHHHDETARPMFEAGNCCSFLHVVVDCLHRKCNKSIRFRFDFSTGFSWRFVSTWNERENRELAWSIR